MEPQNWIQETIDDVKDGGKYAHTRGLLFGTLVGGFVVVSTSVRTKSSISVGAYSRLYVAFDRICYIANVLQNGLRFDPASVNQVSQIVVGRSVGDIRIELNGREVQWFRTIESGPLEDVVHGIKRVVYGLAPVCLSVGVIVAELVHINVHRNGITLVNVRAANVVHQGGHVGQLVGLVVALVEENSDAVDEILGLVETVVSQRVQVAGAVSITTQSVPQIVEGGRELERGGDIIQFD